MYCRGYQYLNIINNSVHVLYFPAELISCSKSTSIPSARRVIKYSKLRFAHHANC